MNEKRPESPSWKKDIDWKINCVRIHIDSKALVQIYRVQIDIDSKALVQIYRVQIDIDSKVLLCLVD